IFFLCTASFQIVEHPLPTSVTQAAGSEPSEPMPPPPPEADLGEIVVRLRLVGGSIQWTLNGVPLNSLDQLRQRLRQIGQVSRQLPVILHPAPAVPLGDVIDAYDAARLERFTVAFT